MAKVHLLTIEFSRTYELTILKFEGLPLFNNFKDVESSLFSIKRFGKRSVAGSVGFYKMKYDFMFYSFLENLIWSFRK